MDEFLETGVPGVYALGDVAGSPPFTHVAYDDYRIVRGRLLGGERRSTRDRLLPYTVFTDPQLGRVGMSERQVAPHEHAPAGAGACSWHDGAATSEQLNLESRGVRC